MSIENADISLLSSPPPCWFISHKKPKLLQQADILVLKSKKELEKSFLGCALESCNDKEGRITPLFTIPAMKVNFSFAGG